MTSQVKIVEQKQGRWLWPVMGFTLVVAVTVLAYFAAPSVMEWVDRTFPRFTIQGMSKSTVRWVFTAVVAGIFMLIAVLMVTLAGRRPRPLDVTNKDLEKEREAMLAEKKMNKRRQRRMNQEMREHVKKNMKS